MEISCPKITIIMATFNRAHLILETIGSLTNQTFMDWECLIIDDGSTDNTSEILEPILENEGRFKYHKRPANHLKGLPGCRNYGLVLAEGDYIVFFDDDDIVHPDNLQIVMDTFGKYEVDYVRYLRDVFVGEFSVCFDRSNSFEVKKLNIQKIGNIITGKIPFNSCQVVWKKNCFNNNIFNEELLYAEEWECYTRILAEGVIGITVEKVLFYGRKHPNSNTGEFWNNDPIRMESKIHAIKLVIDTLEKKNLLSEGIKKYFISLGFMFKWPEIIKYTLKKSDSGLFILWKYKFGYLFYPIIKPIFNLKSKFIKS